jgi:hypothetical protein
MALCVPANRKRSDATSLFLFLFLPPPPPPLLRVLYPPTERAEALERFNRDTLNVDVCLRGVSYDLLLCEGVARVLLDVAVAVAVAVAVVASSSPTLYKLDKFSRETLGFLVGDSEFMYESSCAVLIFF